MRVFIIHGTHGSPGENWIPWLKEKLGQLGVEVIVPEFPTPKDQSLKNWKKVFSKQMGRVDEESVFVGHSLGCAFILSILEEIDIKVKACYFVAGFISKIYSSPFDKLNESFVEKEFNWDKIKQNCEKFNCYVSDTDPFIPINIGQELAEKLDAKCHIVEDAGHFNSEAGFETFEKLFNQMKLDLNFNKTESIEEYWNKKWKKVAVKLKNEKESAFAKRALPIIKKYKKKKLIDIGCGLGKDSLYFAKNGLDVIAADFNETAIELVKKSAKKEKVKLDARVLNHSKELYKLSRKSVDVVYSNLSLQYFKDSILTRMFSDIYNLLDEDGLFIFKIKSTEDDLYGKGRVIEKDMFYMQHVRHFFSKEYLKKKLKSFDIISIKKIKEKSFKHSYTSDTYEVIAKKRARFRND